MDKKAFAKMREAMDKIFDDDPQKFLDTLVK